MLISKPIDPNKLDTETYQQHKPCGYNINVVNRSLNESESYSYRGSDCMEHFVKTCRNIKDKIMNESKVNVPILMTAEDGENFKNAMHCGICDHGVGDDRVGDRCHMTGKYRCCHHSKCNLHFNYKDFKFLFSSIILKVTVHSVICNAHEFQKKKIDVIAQSSEKTLCLDLIVHNLRLVFVSRVHR